MDWGVDGRSSAAPLQHGVCEGAQQPTPPAHHSVIDRGRLLLLGEGAIAVRRWTGSGVNDCSGVYWTVDWNQLHIGRLGGDGQVGEARAGGLRLSGVRGGFSDRELVRFVGLHGAVSVEHVMGAFGVGRTAAYRRVATCISQGLLERLALLREEPAVLRATRPGLRFAGLDLPLCVVSPGSVGHWLRCASVALAMEERCGPGPVIAERELRWIERSEGRPIFSAKLGHHPDGSDRLHRPDLALWLDERPVAVEVELTPKAPRRLEAIIAAWRRAAWVGGVLYVCEPGPTQRGVERAIRKTRAWERVQAMVAIER